jgi:hypothetical protein
MNLVIAASAAVGGEIVLSSMVRRCLMYKMASVSDELFGVMWNLAKIGVGSGSTGTLLLDDNSSKQIPETLLHCKEYEELRKVDLAGSIAFIYHVVRDKRRVIEHQHSSVQRLIKEGDEDIENYFINKANTDNHNNEWQCASPLCTETFQLIFNQLQQSAKVICQQIIQIRALHERYAKYYKLQKFVYGLNDGKYWSRLAFELPILERRTQRFLNAIPWCTMIAHETTQSQAHSSCNQQQTQ